MRARYLLVAALVLLGAAMPLWAGPFTEVPSEHWAYPACARLSSLGMLSSDRAARYSGDPCLTRFEFGVTLLGPLGSIDEALAELGPGADKPARLNAIARALRLSPRLSEDDLAGGLADLRRLADEFSDVMRSFGFDPSAASAALGPLDDRDLLHAWRVDALTRPTRLPALAPGEAAEGGLELPFARGTVALSLTSPPEAPDLLDYLAQSAAAATGAATDGRGEASGVARPAMSDPRVSRLRTAYEYGLGSALTLSLAYEDIARRGLVPLDEASLTSVGIGYQLTPSASVKLSYSLLEYSNYVLDAPLVRDHLAETEVSVEF